MMARTTRRAPTPDYAVIDDLLHAITPIDAACAEAARARWNSIAKPLGALGMLEAAVCRIAAAARVQPPATPDIRRRALAVFCADNGIVAEGVTQTSSDVTATVAKNLCDGAASVCKMARLAHADVFPVDIGMKSAVAHPRMTDLHITRGTRNFLHEDAMTRTDAENAVLSGARLAKKLTAAGYTLLATGEMGIGNTTTASALTAVLLDVLPADVTGAGAGLSAAGVAHKIRVIERGIAARKADAGDALAVLSALGGFDIAGMAGFMLGAAASGVPVVIDGVISQTAALVAVRLCPAANGYLLASHVGSEKASHLLLSALGLSAPINAGMHLGEGTGCMTLLPLLDMALAVYREMPTFADIGIEAYQPQDEDVTTVTRVSENASPRL